MKTNLYMLIVAVLLGIPCFWHGCQGDAEFIDESPRLFEGFITENASVIRMGKPDPVAMAKAAEEAKAKGEDEPKDPIFKSITELVLNNNKWKVAIKTRYGTISLPAVQSKVEELLNNVRDIPRSQTDIVSDDPKDHDAYQVSPKLATHVLIHGKNDAKLAHLLVGRKPEPGEGADYTASQGLFVRKNDEPYVVHFSKSYWTVDTDRSIWLDKNVLTFERDKVKRIVVTNQKGGWTVERDGKDKDKWTLAGPIKGPAKMEHVNNVLNGLSNLYMDEFVAPKVAPEVAKAGVDANARYTVTIEMEDGKTKHKLLVGVNNPDKEGQVFAHITGQDFIFSVGKHLTESMRKPAADIKEEPKKDPKKDAAKDGAKPAPKDPKAGDAGKPQPPVKKTAPVAPGGDTDAAVPKQPAGTGKPAPKAPTQPEPKKIVEPAKPDKTKPEQSPKK